MKLTCVVPAKNEEGHIAAVLNQIQSIESISEVLVVIGKSKDETYSKALEISKNYPKKIKILEQIGTGKFNAVRLGASVASEEFLIIWDADGTVPLTCTKKLIDHAVSSKNVTIGNRLTGKIEPGAMQFLNLLGNWAFAVAWYPLLGNKLSDMLCGTKIVSTKIFKKLPAWLLKIDPYGDFTLIAASIMDGYQIDSVSVNYLKRRYGSTNINRWSGGLKLLVTTLLVYIWYGKKLIKRG